MSRAREEKIVIYNLNLNHMIIINIKYMYEAGLELMVQFPPLGKFLKPEIELVYI